MSESPQSLFDSLAAEYEEMRRELHWDPFPHIREALQDRNPKGMRVLDAGCGTGECTRWLQSLGADPYGIDISPEMCFLAADRSENIPYLTHDLQDPLPFDDRRFDMVVALGCLEYLEDIESTVAEFARVLSPGGVFLGCFERCGDDCPGGNARQVTFFDDWVRYRIADRDLEAMLQRHFSHVTLSRVPGFMLTDDDGNETGKVTQYIRAICIR